MLISPLGWLWRVVVCAVLVTVAVLYRRGLGRYEGASFRPKWQTNAFYVGLILLAIALISPIESYVSTYFTARALQQLLITELVPFLLLIANPYRPILSGLPPSVRSQFAWLRGERVVALIRVIAAPAAAWILFVTTFWFWHDRTMMGLANRYPLVHLLEVGSLLGLASVYWWHIVSAEPRMFRPMPTLVRFFYAFVGILAIKATGIIMLFGSESRVGGYTDHSSAESVMVNLFGIQLADSSAGAILIWIIGGIMYSCAALLMASRFISVEEDKPPLPVNPLEEEELWRMPGVGRESGRNRYGYKTRL